MVITKEKYAELKETNPDIAVFTAMGHDFAFKPPSHGEWRRFQDTVASDDRKRIGAVETLVKVCMLFPPQDELKQIVEALPGIYSTLFPELAALAGAGVTIEKKVF